jgi:uncharacterized protein (DUF433 family)
MNGKEYITVDPNVLCGKPVVRGTRVGVEFLLELFAHGWTREQVLENYPGVTAGALNSILGDASVRSADR